MERSPSSPPRARRPSRCNCSPAAPTENLWFTDGAGYVGDITTSGASTEYPLPDFCSYPWGIAAGSDGQIWFADPLELTTGSDGNLWMNENGVDKIARIVLQRDGAYPGRAITRA